LSTDHDIPIVVKAKIWKNFIILIIKFF
jgi:hypothetical protein